MISLRFKVRFCVLGLLHELDELLEGSVLEGVVCLFFFGDC